MSKNHPSVVSTYQFTWILKNDSEKGQVFILNSRFLTPSCNERLSNSSSLLFSQCADDFYLNNYRVVNLERKWYRYEIESWLVQNLHLEY